MIFELVNKLENELKAKEAGIDAKAGEVNEQKRITKLLKKELTAKRKDLKSREKELVGREEVMSSREKRVLKEDELLALKDTNIAERLVLDKREKKIRQEHDEVIAKLAELHRREEKQTYRENEYRDEISKEFVGKFQKIFKD